jgi:hypothetical protein
MVRIGLYFFLKVMNPVCEKRRSNSDLFEEEIGKISLTFLLANATTQGTKRPLRLMAQTTGYFKGCMKGGYPPGQRGHLPQRELRIVLHSVLR